MESINISPFVSDIIKEETNNEPYQYNNIRISIVIPSYNQGNFIERTLLSIINQQYPDTEIIIIDGGSTDNTLEVIKKYAKYINFWVSERDRGQSHALNKGFARASGNIFGWLNSDDLYLPGTFRKIAKSFAKFPEKTVCYGDWLSIDEFDSVIDVTYALPVPTPHFSYENMNSYNQSLFWRRDAHKRLGGLDEELHYLMDVDMIARLIINEGKNKFLSIPEFLGAFRLYFGQKTKKTIDEERIKEDEYINNKLNFYPSNNLLTVYHKMTYRLFQLHWSLRRGGVQYTINQIISGVGKRGGIL